MENIVTMTVKELEDLLHQQKVEVAEYITRNTSVYSWWNSGTQGTPIERINEELRLQALKSPYCKDFQILKKYLK